MLLQSILYELDGMFDRNHF